MPRRGPSKGVAGEPEPLSFETALEQLEAIVGRLEAGDLPLEEALELFENGVELSRRCNATLDSAERRIEILTADRSPDQAGEGAAGGGPEDPDRGLEAGSWVARPFDAPIDDPSGDDPSGDDEEDGDEGQA